MYKPRVLFLCTGNSARSQMAQAFLRTYAGEHFDIYSAGLEPKGYILPEVLAVMRERGIDLSGQTSKSVSEYLGRLHFSHVITVCGDASERLEFTRRVCDQIDDRIKKWVKSQNIVSQPV